MPVFAAAETSTYSNVLDDLKKDKSFNVEDYPYNGFNYSLQVIQIAESKQDELLIYVYQPAVRAVEFKATSINMSLSEEPDGTQLYDLTLISKQGVFQKYVVKNFIVRKDETRYYNISTIYRPWNGDIDDPPPEGNVTNEVGYRVGVVFIAANVNGDVVYDHYDVEVIYVTDKYVGSVMLRPDYYQAKFPGFTHGSSNLDLIDIHYVAFSTNYSIDKLLEADISYAYQPVEVSATTFLNWFALSGESKYGDERETVKPVDFTQDVDLTEFGSVKTSDRIMTADKFIEDYSKKSSTNGVDDTKGADGQEWVIIFNETSRSQSSSTIFGVTTYNGKYTYISKVSILRLKFDADGKIYNLGVVDNKQSPVKPLDPSGLDFWDKLTVWLSKSFGTTITRNQAIAIFWAVIAVVAVIALIIFSILFPAFGKVLWFIISAPFKGIAALVKLIKEKKDGG